MKSLDTIYNNTINYVEECLKLLARNSKQIADPKSAVEIDRENIIDAAIKQAATYAYYQGLYSTCRGALKQCERTLDLVDGELYDHYRNQYEIKLSSNEIKYYITHDSRHRELIEIISTIDKQALKIDAIVQAVVAKGFSINNIVKLKQIEADQKRYETPINI